MAGDVLYDMQQGSLRDTVVTSTTLAFTVVVNGIYRLVRFSVWRLN